MVVGVDLLRQLGPVDNHIIQFVRNRKTITLQGLQQEATLKIMNAKQFKKTIRKENRAVFGCLYMILADQVFKDCKATEELQTLLIKYLYLFDTCLITPLSYHPLELMITKYL